MTLALPPNHMDVADHGNTTTAFITLDAFDGQKALKVIDALENCRNDDYSKWHELITQKALKVIDALENCRNDDYSKWHELITSDDVLRARLRVQGLETPEDRVSIIWDDATLLFVSCVEKNKSGQNYSLGDGRIRDRFGRFPWGDGSSLNYLLEFIRPPLSNVAIVERIDCEEIVDLLKKLTSQCSDEVVGHSNYQLGA